MCFSQIKKVTVAPLKTYEGLQESPYFEVPSCGLKNKSYAVIRGRKKGTKESLVNGGKERVWFPYSPKIYHISNDFDETLASYNSILRKWAQTQIIRIPVCLVLVENSRSTELEALRIAYIGDGEKENRNQRNW